MSIGYDENLKFRQVYDITPRDIRIAVRALVDIGCICVTRPERFHDGLISGLKINDLENAFSIMMGLKLPFERVSVPLRPIWNHDVPIVLAFHLGLRWYILPGNLSGDPINKTVWSDDRLRYIAYVAYVHNNGERTPSPQVSCTYGPYMSNVIVRHGSGRPIDWHHVHAFNNYLDEVRFVEDLPTKEGFKEYWAEYAKKLRKMRRGMPTVPSPYTYEGSGYKDMLCVIRPELVISAIQHKVSTDWSSILEDLDRGYQATVMNDRRAMTEQEVVNLHLKGQLA